MTDKLRPKALEILRNHGLRPRRSLGQNFLEDPAALQQVADAADASPDDDVLEIGAGVGSLTRYLAPRARRVVAVEVDAALAGICRSELRALHNVEIVEADVLCLSPQELGLRSGYLVAANIPYYITSPILRHLLESTPRPRRIVMTIQQEVAARICARPPSMSLLAVSVQIHGDAHVVAKIPARAFRPTPKVDSAIICIDCYSEPRLDPPMLDAFFRAAKAGFSQPRKMLRNSMAAGLRLAPSQVEPLLTRAQIDPRRRAETLTIDEWIRLAGYAPIDRD